MKKTIFPAVVFLVLFFSFTLVRPGATDEKAGQAVVETSLGFSRIVDMEFDQALQKVKAGLKEEGFGILTEVDVQATMKKKLDID